MAVRFEQLIFKLSLSELICVSKVRLADHKSSDTALLENKAISAFCNELRRCVLAVANIQDLDDALDEAREVSISFTSYLVGITTLKLLTEGMQD